MKRALILLIFVLSSCGCIEESGHWQEATVISKVYDNGSFFEGPSNIVVFNDTSGNFFVLQDYPNPLHYPNPLPDQDLIKKLEVNNTYLIHVTNDGAVDKVGIGGE